MRDRIAEVIFKNQPMPIPINPDEARHLADALLREFEIKEREE